MAFDTEILMPNISRAEFDNMMIDQSFQAFERQDFKAEHMLKLDGKKTYTDNRVISKILKLDENNEYVSFMTKISPTGYIKKQKKIPTWPELNMLFEREEATFKHNNV